MKELIDKLTTALKEKDCQTAIICCRLPDPNKPGDYILNGKIFGNNTDLAFLYLHIGNLLVDLISKAVTKAMENK